MRKISLLLALVASFAVSQARADFTAKDASAATITFKGTGVCTSVVCVPLFTLFDPTGTNGAAVDTAGADAVSNTKNALATYSRLVVYNGTTWDRWQGAVSIASGKVASGAFASGSIASGAMVDVGAQADTAWTSGSGSVIAILKNIANGIASAVSSLASIATNTAASIPGGSANIGGVELFDAGGTNKATISAGGALKTDGSAVTQPISAASLPLPTGAATAASQTVDPCSLANKTNLPISFQTTSITQQIALSGSTKIYVCSLSLISSVPTVFSVTGGTGTNCGTPAALIGTTSASHGLSLAANGGMTLGSGVGTIAVTAAGSELCLVQSGAGDLSGNLTYVQQ